MERDPNDLRRVDTCQMSSLPLQRSQIGIPTGALHISNGLFESPAMLHQTAGELRCSPAGPAG